MLCFFGFFATLLSGEKFRGRATSDSHEKCGETLIAIRNVGRKIHERIPKVFSPKVSFSLFWGGISQFNENPKGKSVAFNGRDQFLG